MTDDEMIAALEADSTLYLFYARSRARGETLRDFVEANRETVEAVIDAARRNPVQDAEPEAKSDRRTGGHPVALPLSQKQGPTGANPVTGASSPDNAYQRWCESDPVGNPKDHQ